MTFSCLGIFLNCQVLIFSDGILFDYLGWLGGGEGLFPLVYVMNCII